MSRDNLRKSRVSDSVCRHIEEMILLGIVKPGERLPAERELAQRLEVSRTSLRDALIRLEARGLVQVRPGGGTFVRDILGPTLTEALQQLLKDKPAALYDLLELRSALEEVAAYYAATRRTASDREILRRRLGEIERAHQEQDAYRTAIAIADFQLSVVDASHNIALMHVTRGLYSILRAGISRALQMAFVQPDSYEAIHAYRVAIVDAIAARRPEDARDAAHDLIVFVNNALREIGDEIFDQAPQRDTDIFQPIAAAGARRKMSDGIVERIEKLVSDAVLGPGEQLPAEEVLAENFRVSRTVVREAMVKLEAKGLLQVRRGGAITVSESPGPTITDPLVHLLAEHSDAMFDFLELRRALEELAAWYAARRATEADKRKLERSFERLNRGYDEADLHREAHLGAEFHLAIAEASHNLVLVCVMRGLFNLLRRNIYKNLERLAAFPEEYGATRVHRADILRHIVAGDGDSARQAAHVHVKFIDRSLRELGYEQMREAQSQRRLDILAGEQG